jgi:hypothetical protein
MKMVKSLLLGTAAALVAMTGAQAADLPVKAKPVQYVKICSLYGAGFYYIPGTDTCLKVGGWVRAEYAYGDNGNMAWGPFNGNANNLGTNNSTWRSRGYITADARDQSAYGTIRSYIAVGLSTNDVGLNTAANQFSANRAFIQFAGFTFGIAQSFFDFYSNPATAFWGSYPGSDTGDPGWLVAGYTAQFGGGFSATISAEMRRLTQIIAPAGAGTTFGGSVVPGAFPGALVDPTTGLPIAGTAGVFPGAGNYGGFQAPDIVGNLRVDQAWGAAQVMGALHSVNSRGFAGGGVGAHPDTEIGWAVGLGLKLNAPMIGAGDYLQAQVNWASGASRYTFFTPNSNWGKVDTTAIATSRGILSDAVVTGAAPGSLDLTDSWSANVAYEHFWNPAWRTSVYGGYAAVSYSAAANAAVCGIQAGAIAGCDNDWSTWWVGTRTQWNLTRNLYVGVDLLYQKLDSATVTATDTDVDNWAVRFRVHRDFYP